MRILFKIVLFPISLILAVVVHVSCFLVERIGGLLSVVSFLLFMGVLLMVGFAVFKSDTYWQPAIISAVISFIISPYGLPKIAVLLVCKIDELNGMIKSI